MKTGDLTRLAKKHCYAIGWSGPDTLYREDDVGKTALRLEPEDLLLVLSVANEFDRLRVMKCGSGSILWVHVDWLKLVCEVHV